MNITDRLKKSGLDDKQISEVRNIIKDLPITITGRNHTVNVDVDGIKVSDTDENTSIDSKYLNLLKDILSNGVDKGDRTGTGTKSVFGREIRHKMSEGFPLLTTKRVPFKTMVTELMWFLRGDSNIQYLVQNGCNIWNGDCYKTYQNITNKEMELNNSMVEHPDYGLSKKEFVEKIKINDKFANKWGELGPIYGKQWRGWTNYEYSYGNIVGNNSIDQIQNVLDTLKNNPDSRRMLVSAWNVGELDTMVLPPCHYGFQVYTRELTHVERGEWWIKNGAPYNPNNLSEFFSINELNDANVPKRVISLKWHQRSVDVFLGLPFNIASYALLLKLIAKEVNMIPDELVGTLGDTHLYSNHLEQAKLQITREPLKLPEVDITSESIFDLDINDFKLVGYESHPTIKAPLSN